MKPEPSMYQGAVITLDDMSRTSSSMEFEIYSRQSDTCLTYLYG